jgi:hypothetical protein
VSKRCCTQASLLSSKNHRLQLFLARGMIRESFRKVFVGSQCLVLSFQEVTSLLVCFVFSYSFFFLDLFFCLSFSLLFSCFSSLFLVLMLSFPFYSLPSSLFPNIVFLLLDSKNLFSFPSSRFSTLSSFSTLKQSKFQSLHLTAPLQQRIQSRNS